MTFRSRDRGGRIPSARFRTGLPALWAVLLLALVCSACGPSEVPAPRAVALGRDTCALCRQTITSLDAAAQAVFSDGTTRVYDDLGCLATDRATLRRGGQLYVQFAGGKGWARVEDVAPQRDRGVGKTVVQRWRRAPTRTRIARLSRLTSSSRCGAATSAGRPRESVIEGRSSCATRGTARACAAVSMQHQAAAAPGQGGRMRVLVLDTERGWRGGQRQTLLLARELARRGEQCYVAARPLAPLAERARLTGAPGGARGAHRRGGAGHRLASAAVHQAARRADRPRPDGARRHAGRHVHAQHHGAPGRHASPCPGRRAPTRAPAGSTAGPPP